MRVADSPALSPGSITAERPQKQQCQELAVLGNSPRVLQMLDAPVCHGKLGTVVRPCHYDKGGWMLNKFRPVP